MRKLRNLGSRLCLASTLAMACGGDDAGRTTASDGGGVNLTTATEGGSGDADAGNSGIKLDMPGADDTAGPPMGEEDCAAVGEMAEQTLQPADIVFVVDNSGSMDFEAGQIQQQLNGFSNLITASGVDARVVLISSYPSNGNGICIDPPLGGGGCPNDDNNNPVYLHVDRRVSSTDALSAILETYPQWSTVMRPEASKHFVVVTDDESNLAWDQFDTQFQALDPTLASYVFHSVVCHTNCPSAADIGSEYIQLSALTQGVAADLCDQDFFAVFDVLSTQVVSGAQISCEFEIPPPPDGMEFDPDFVNVEFDDGMGGILPIGKVDSVADCPNVVDGWYYDNPAAPTMVLLCEQTCTKVQNSMDGSMSIIFGCGTMPAG
jgi:hypothetical protein